MIDFGQRLVLVALVSERKVSNYPTAPLNRTGGLNLAGIEMPVLVHLKVLFCLKNLVVPDNSILYVRWIQELVNMDHLQFTASLF